MRFLTDQDVYHQTIDWLHSHAHDVVKVADINMDRAIDIDLVMHARENERILITRDLATYHFQR